MAILLNQLGVSAASVVQAVRTRTEAKPTMLRTAYVVAVPAQVPQDFFAEKTKTGAPKHQIKIARSPMAQAQIWMIVHVALMQFIVTNFTRRAFYAHL